MIKQNLMTILTYNRLLAELEKVKEDEEKARKAIGTAAGAESDWHDNAAFDWAQMQYDLALSRLNALKMKVQNFKIITPRKETDTVGVGNSVILEIIATGEKKKYTVLGADDCQTKESWISFETPLAKSILGKKVGQIARYNYGDNVQEVKIVEILEGEF